MRATIPVFVLVAHLATAQGFESLKCHGLRTPRAAPRTTLDLTALHADFAAQGCTLVGPMKTFCEPVHMSNLEPSPTGPAFSAPDLSRGYACYKVTCHGVPDRHEVADQIGAGQEDFFHSAVLCVPTITDGDPQAQSALSDAQGFDALKCHRSRTPRDSLDRTVDLAALHADFAAQGCGLKGRTKTFCSPVHLNNPQPPAAGPPFSAPELTRDFTCYKLRCAGGLPDAHGVTDLFGMAQEGFNRERLLCLPAVTTNCEGGQCGSYSTTCHESGQCTCFALSRRQSFCGVPAACDNLEPCKAGDEGSAGTCPTGFVCEVNTCCGKKVCVPATSLCAPGDPPPPGPPSGVLTTVGISP